LCFDYDTDKAGNVWIRNEIALYGGPADVVTGVQGACSLTGGVYTYEIAIPLWSNWLAGTGRQALAAGDTVYVYSIMQDAYGTINGMNLTFCGNPAFDKTGFVNGAALVLAGGNPALAGDANHDNKVDVSDLGILAANYGTTAGATWEQGDFNHDGKVDVSDLGILAANYGTGTGAVLDFNADAKALGLSSETKEEAPGTSAVGCGSAGLPIVAGLLLVGMLLIKLDE
jgi:hypothetical protein